MIAIRDDDNERDHTRHHPNPRRGDAAGTRAPARWHLTGTDFLPDVRDGLTRAERVVLYVLHKAQGELGRDEVPTGLLYGRVIEHINIRPDEFQSLLRKLGAADKIQRPPEDSPR